MNHFLDKVCHYSIYYVRQFIIGYLVTIFHNIGIVTKGYFATLFVTSQLKTGYASMVLKTVVDVHKTTVYFNFNFVTNKLYPGIF